jgi:hypothetical protein
VTVLDVNGNVLSTFSPHGTGEQMPLERIDDMP